MIADAWFYVIAVPVALLTGVSKGGFGAAMGGIGVALMALVLPVPQAAAIMVPILCLSDLFGFRIYLWKWDRPNVRILIPGGLLGIVAGAFAVGVLSEPAIRLIVGAIAVLFTLYRWLGDPERKPPASPSRAKGTFWASISGFTSFIAHAGGPPAMIYLLPQRLDKTTYVATANLFFMVVNAAKIVPYAALGQFSRTNLVTSAVLAPMVPAGVWLGLWMHRRVNQLWFYRVVQALLFVTGTHLLIQGLGHYLPGLRVPR